MKKNRKRRVWPIVLTVVLVLALLGTAAVAAVWHLNEYTMTMSLRGDGEMTLGYGADFEDPGAESYFWGSYLLKEMQEVPVTVEGTVDTDTVGSYRLTYTATIHYKDLFWDRTETRQLSRTVHVVDGDAPVITLNEVDEYYTLPGAEYVEEGYTAFDGYDGDLTDQVVRTVADGIVTYTVTDSSGNTVSVSRAIFYDDPISPEIQLSGDGEVTLTEGETFTDPGCTASDNCDGDITDQIVVTGTVDTETPGTYTLTYTVSDAWGNSVSTQRTVVVKEKPAPPPTEPPTEPPETQPPVKEPDVPAEPLPPNGKVIYLTFDDGPGRHTARLLDILAKYDVKATFFVIHTGYMDLLPRMAQEGHTVAMHAYDHTYSTIYASDEAYLADLKRLQDEIFAYTGQTATILRFPGGSSNTASKYYSRGIMTRMTQKVEEMGYRYFDWNIDSYDAGGATSAGSVYRNVCNGIAKSGRSSFVVLQHDVKGFSVDAVEDIIRWGLANGYTFAALTNDSPSCEHSLNN